MYGEDILFGQTCLNNGLMSVQLNAVQFHAVTTQSNSVGTSGQHSPYCSSPKNADASSDEGSVQTFRDRTVSPITFREEIRGSTDRLYGIKEPVSPLHSPCYSLVDFDASDEEKDKAQRKKVVKEDNNRGSTMNPIMAPSDSVSTFPSIDAHVDDSQESFDDNNDHRQLLQTSTLKTFSSFSWGCYFQLTSGDQFLVSTTDEGPTTGTNDNTFGSPLEHIDVTPEAPLHALGPISRHVTTNIRLEGGRIHHYHAFSSNEYTKVMDNLIAATSKPYSTFEVLALCFFC